jgi:hypothetical protein
MPWAHEVGGSNPLAPILVNSTTEALSGHWSEKFKEEIRNNFFNNTNFVEMDYSEYRGASW